jgi:hypothetical protein
MFPEADHLVNINASERGLIEEFSSWKGRVSIHMTLAIQMNARRTIFATDVDARRATNNLLAGFFIKKLQ